jgi:hypothetical protein
MGVDPGPNSERFVNAGVIWADYFAGCGVWPPTQLRYGFA